MNRTHPIIPDISAIIPAFNVQDYIGEALVSALSQDPPFTQIIVIDDGSTDNTRHVINQFHDNRIVYHHQDNRGLGPARNTGIDLSKSEFLYFMDADDVLMSGMTKFVQHKLRQSNEPVDAVLFSATEFEHEDGHSFKHNDYYKRKATGIFSSGKAALLASLHHGQPPSSACLYVFRRAVIEIPKRLRFEDILHEDELFTPALLMSCGNTVVTNEALYKRRIRSGSITTAPASTRNVTGYLLAARWWSSQAALATLEASHMFFIQSYYFYSLAIFYAARAKLRLNVVKNMTNLQVPQFTSFISIDYFLSKLSRKSTFRIINLRARVHLFIVTILRKG